MGDSEDQLAYVDLVEQEEGGSADSSASRAGRLVDEGSVPVPPDAPLMAERDEVTPAGQRHGASLDERLRAEVPDVIASPVDEPGRLTNPGGDQVPDDEPDLVAAVAGDDLDLTAEELAMRIEEGPSAGLGGTDDASDGYVEPD